jgi:hypothetical protein
MNLNIIPIHNDGLRCIDDLTITVVNWYRKRYELCFINSWGFSFDSNKLELSGILGDKLGPGNRLIEENAEKYYGIKAIYHDTKSAEEVLRIVNNELNKEKPVAIFIDSFHCPWHIDYQNYHNEHFCLVVGTSKDSDLYCIDSSPINSDCKLPLNNLLLGFRNCITYNVANRVVTNLEFKNILSEYICKLSCDNKYDIFSSMMEFSFKFEKIENVLQEIKGYSNISRSPIIVALYEIYGSRFLFSKLLKYIAGECKLSHLIYFSEKLEVAAGKWQIIRAVLVKNINIPTDKSYIKKLGEKIREVAAYERGIATELNEYLSKAVTNVQPQVEAKNMERKGETVCINLTEYFNNRGFGTEIDAENDADLTGMGQYFLNQGLPQQDIWELESTKFIFPKTLKKRFDNISCNNQLIALPESNYSEIAFLGCSEWGSYSESLIVNYKDESSHEIIIKFSDWSKEAVFNDTIAWTGSRTSKKNPTKDKKPDGKIYAKAYPLDFTKEIKSICLPACSNIHIFAISLVKLT